MIVKCQYSLANNIGRTTMLFYDKDRSRLGEFEMFWEWEQHFKAYGAKFFAEVHWPASEKIPVFIKRVDNQPW